MGNTEEFVLKHVETIFVISLSKLKSKCQLLKCFVGLTPSTTSAMFFMASPCFSKVNFPSVVFCQILTHIYFVTFVRYIFTVKKLMGFTSPFLTLGWREVNVRVGNVDKYAAAKTYLLGIVSFNFDRQTPTSTSCQPFTGGRQANNSVYIWQLDLVVDLAVANPTSKLHWFLQCYFVYILCKL